MPTHLYHGSAHLSDELMPGFLRIGTKLEWDNTESNEYLYAISDKNEAISQAFASMIEQNFLLHRYKTSDNQTKIRIEFDDNNIPDEKFIQDLKVYIYKIIFDISDNWVEVKNNHNGLTGEYKTKEIIKNNIERVETIFMKDWLKGKEISLVPKFGLPVFIH